MQYILVKFRDLNYNFPLPDKYQRLGLENFIICNRGKPSIKFIKENS